jgi:hypothetical protein
MLEGWSNASTTNLEDQGISLRLTSHFHSIRQEDLTSSYTTADTAFGILEVCKPNHPVQRTFVKVKRRNYKTTKLFNFHSSVVPLMLHTFSVTLEVV